MSLCAPPVVRQARPSLLVAHADYPGQFGGFAHWAAAQGWSVWATAEAGACAETDLRPIRCLPYTPHRAPAPETHPYAQPFDRAALVGQASLRTCLAAGDHGLTPDVILSHAGPGPGLFLQDAFPRARQIAYCEWWYNSPGADVAFLNDLAGPSHPQSPETAILEHSRNLPIATELLSAGQGICPTPFQTSQFPDALSQLLTVQHDGIDCNTFCPAPPGPTQHPDLKRITPDHRVVSYATRGMEPHRGFPQAMAAFAQLQARDPEVLTLIAGTNRVCYGGDQIRKVDWKAKALTDHNLDPNRTIFTGPLNAFDYLWLLRRSDAHLYATVPFVLSWSMLEAMATQTPLVLSDTAPVRDHADHACAHMVDLARPDDLADALADCLADRAAAHRRARTARDRIQDTCSTTLIYPQKAALLTGMCARPARSRPSSRKDTDMTRKVTKAIFPVAGLGTRFLPATKSIPKEIMTLVDRPLIQYAIDEARAAGITDFIFVTSRGKSALEDYFDHSPILEQDLKSKGKTALLDVLDTTNMDSGAIAYIRQHKALGLGHSIWCARRLIGDEPFAVILPDDVIAAEKPCLQQMVDAYQDTGGNMVAAMEVPSDKTSAYGILDVARDMGNLVRINGMVEKPSVQDAPSNLAVIGRYILTPRILYNLDCNIRNQTLGAGGELQLTDAIADEISGQGVYGYRFDGERFDCGSKAGFLQATVAFGMARPELRDEFVQYLNAMHPQAMAAE